MCRKSKTLPDLGLQSLLLRTCKYQQFRLRLHNFVSDKNVCLLLKHNNCVRYLYLSQLIESIICESDYAIPFHLGFVPILSKPSPFFVLLLPLLFTATSHGEVPGIKLFNHIENWSKGEHLRDNVTPILHLKIVASEKGGDFRCDLLW